MFRFSGRFAKFVGNNLTSLTSMHTQSQWGWRKHSGRAVVEPQFELAGVKPPRILVFVFLRVASTKRCLTEYDFLWPIQPVVGIPANRTASWYVRIIGFL
jgi:hypothetical protein